jgi:hypothetical protein
LSKKSIVTKEDSLKARALQILNLRYLIESDIKSSYKRRIIQYHPDKHPEARSNPKKLEDYENKIKIINQSYELLLDSLQGIQVNLSKYSLLEETNLVQSMLPPNAKPTPLGKTELEIWTENFGNML